MVANKLIPVALEMHLNPSSVPKRPSSPELSTPLFATTIPFLSQFEPMTGILNSDLSYYWLLPTSTNDYEEWRTYLMNEREWNDEMAAFKECATLLIESGFKVESVSPTSL